MITFRLANIRPAKESLPDNTILFPFFTQTIFKVKTVSVKDVLETDIFCILLPNASINVGNLPFMLQSE